MPSYTLRCATAACLILAANPSISQVSAQSTPARTASAQPAPDTLSYADLADLAIDAPLVAKAQISDVILLPPSQAAGVPAGFRRAYVEARVLNLIRGEGGITPVISYLYDIPVDSYGKLPKLKKRQVLVFARPGTRPGQVQLTARDGQIDWSAPREAGIKAIVSELLANGAPPRITFVGDAFHVAGTIAGEGETQIFLKTNTGEPVSLSVIRRPGQEPQWAVALGEIMDEAAAPPTPDSLLWYQLACALPPALPAHSVRSLSVLDSEAARRDYTLILNALGTCSRGRQGPARR